MRSEKGTASRLEFLAANVPVFLSHSIPFFWIRFKKVFRLGFFFDLCFLLLVTGRLSGQVQQVKEWLVPNEYLFLYE